MRQSVFRTAALLAPALLALLSGCTINPVTGERQLALVSAEDEVAIGREQYLPSQQMQGGEYLGDPALTSYVRNVGNSLAAVSDRALPYEFVIINSSVPNAWALPGGKIGINRGLLLELGSEAELAAVLGHEIVHAAARHSAIAMQRGILLQGAVLAASVATRDRDYSGLAVGAAGLGAQLINMRHGRDNELEADAYGMRYMSEAGYDANAAVDLQQTFVRLSEGRDNAGWLAGLFSSHPPSAERVSRNRATATTLPAGGTIGRDTYRNAIARLSAQSPGYEALDAASEALAAGDLSAARRQATTALERIPNEAQAEALLGDIEMAERRPNQALERYRSAISLNDSFFYFHLGSGKANLELDRLAQAEAAFETSIALLPTGDAYLGLGRVAERRNNIPLALEHYQRAAESSGASGTEARGRLLRLDLPQNPGRYLAVASRLDTNGRLVVELSNPTSVTVAGIGLSVRYVRDGDVFVAQRALQGALAPNTRQQIATNLGPFTSSADYQIVIDSARVVESP